tara:strand:- start:38 stop:364 length:327 start_codon:yes stop_codon:yes gene_type:complete
MIKFIKHNHFKNLSLILVISFFFVHNIFLVQAGILIAIFEINKDYLYDKNSFNKKKIADKEIEINSSIKIESKKMDLNRDKERLTLVETVEELGYIPSKGKGEDTNAA